MVTEFGQVITLIDLIMVELRTAFQADLGGAVAQAKHAECCDRCRIDPRVDARLTHLPIGTNPAQVIVREESNWVCDISATGSIQRRRQHSGL